MTPSVQSDSHFAKFGNAPLRDFDRTRLVLFALAAALALVPIGNLVIRAWTLNDFGLSVHNQKPPTWDFANLWMGGRLAVTQSIEATFSPELFRAGMRAFYGGAPVEASEWSYPPSLLLIGAPLGMLPQMAAYALFQIGGLVALFFTCRSGRLSTPLCLLVVLSPAAIFNATFGQNGAWTAALLLGGLMFSDRRPVLAGLLLGLLTMKPHLGLLAPLCLIAAGRWPAFGWAAFFSVLIAALTTALFGVESWSLFLAETRPLMKSILEAPWGSQHYQTNGVTPFHLARALGAEVNAAYAVQAAVSLGAAVAAWRLWRRDGGDPLLRAAVTALLTILASPYGWTYDLVPLSVALVALAAIDRERAPVPLAFGFLYPALNGRITVYFLPLFPVMIGFTIAACWRAATGPLAGTARPAPEPAAVSAAPA